MIRNIGIALILFLGGLFLLPDEQIGAAEDLSCRLTATILAQRLVEENLELKDGIVETIVNFYGRVPFRKRKQFLKALRNAKISDESRYFGAVNPPEPLYSKLFKMAYNHGLANVTLVGPSGSKIQPPESNDIYSLYGLLGNRQKVYLSITQRIIDHPITRFILVHEISHLSRFINAWGGTDWLHYYRNRYTKDGILEEERMAFGDTYDEIHRVIDAATYEEHLTPFRAPPDQEQVFFDRAKEVGLQVVEIEDESGSIQRRITTPSANQVTPETDRLLADLYTAGLNDYYVNMIEEAFTLSRDEFIAMRLSGFYELSQEYNNLMFEEYKKANHHKSFKVGAVIASQYLIYKLFF